jgi:type IV pilus assembly protein PilA
MLSISKKKPEGFTLIELMVVIVIIGILAAIAIPKFMDASTKAKFSEIPTVISAYEHGQLAYLAENASLAPAETDMIYDKPTNSKWFSYIYTVPAANSCTYTGKVAPGKSVGSFDNASAGATSIIATTATSPVHDKGAFTRYIPNF